MSSFASLAAAALIATASALGAASAQASPLAASALDSHESAVAEAAHIQCYPRLVWTYRVGFGPRLVPLGRICIPSLARPLPLPGPGPDPAPFKRIGVDRAY